MAVPATNVRDGMIRVRDGMGWAGVLEIRSADTPTIVDCDAGDVRARTCLANLRRDRFSWISGVSRVLAWGEMRRT